MLSFCLGDFGRDYYCEGRMLMMGQACGRDLLYFYTLWRRDSEACTDERNRIILLTRLSTKVAVTGRHATFTARLKRRKT
jgi:hypothetical protein